LAAARARLERLSRDPRQLDRILQLEHRLRRAHGELLGIEGGDPGHDRERRADRCDRDDDRLKGLVCVLRDDEPDTTSACDIGLDHCDPEAQLVTAPLRCLRLQRQFGKGIV